MRRIVVVVAVATIVGCTPALSPEVLKTYQDRTLYTCCNLHQQGGAVSDANYYDGAVVSLGSTVHVESAARSSVTVTADGTKLTLSQDYGRDQESFQQYLDKILVPDDPKQRLASYSRAVQDAIREGRVEKGMTKEQVLMSLGYPPTHRTASTSANDWTYWYNHWVTYRVVFDDTGKVSNVIGRPAPTQDQPIPQEVPKAKPTPAAKKRR